ncbi:retrovirus-related pol polyprotein from transposon TNT 1-94 [Tanacetum coccineum]
MFGSLCYPTNDRDDLGKMKPKADIGIFIGYSETSRGFQIYNRHTKKIMETIHVKFDKRTAMASEHDSLEPVSQHFLNDDSSAKSMNTPSKEDLANLFEPMYEEYFEKKSSDMPINFAAQQVHNQEDSSSTSSIDIDLAKARTQSLQWDRESNLYTISIPYMATSSPVCLMYKAYLTKSWLWHHILSHLNFGTINDLTKHDLFDGLLNFKYVKDHLCSTCERGKSKKYSHPPKVVPSSHSKLELLHMDLCGPMRMASINGKNYILVIVDDYSRFTWVYFLHSKDETPEIIKKFIAQVQLNYDAKIHKI